jgi:hypothetical protein
MTTDQKLETLLLGQKFLWKTQVLWCVAIVLLFINAFVHAS